MSRGISPFDVLQRTLAARLMIDLQRLCHYVEHRLVNLLRIISKNPAIVNATITTNTQKLTGETLISPFDSAHSRL